MADVMTRFKLVVKEIKRHETKVEETLSSSDIDYIQVINGKLLELEKSLTDSFLEVEDSNAEYDSFVQHQDLVLSLLSKLRSKVVCDKKPNVSEIGRSSNNLKLPKFDLPIFYGDINKWISFKEIFLTSIDKNVELSELFKFQYLLSCVRGSALKLISGFALSAENYPHAWQTLVARFDNKRELAFAQVSKLFNLKQIKFSSSKLIFEILDTCNEVLRSLLTLGFEQNEMVDLIIIHLVLSKIDDQLRQSWELSLSSQDIPRFSEFVSFLERQAKSLSTKDNMVQTEPKSKLFQKRLVVNNAVIKSENPLACSCCHEFHPIFRCQKFFKMSIEERWNFIRAQKLCANCLRRNHFANKCLSNSSCKSCQKKHHTMLHRFVPDYVNTSNVNNTEVLKLPNVAPIQEDSQINTTCFTSKSTESNTLLSTALIRLKNSVGEFVNCRALIDNGSQRSLITESCCKRLNLPISATKHFISGINNTLVETSMAEVSLIFTPHFRDRTFQTTALVVNKVTTDLPNFKFSSWNWPHLIGLTLADPTFAFSGPIDLLIGAELYADIIIGTPMFGAKGSPAAINSHLGWLVSGRIFNSSKPSNSVVNCHATLDLDSQLKRFWEIEAIPTLENVTNVDTLCEDLYESTVERDDCGRFTIKLPFKDKPCLGESASQALRRFNNLENKLIKDPSLNEQYSTFMKEYLDLNHMEQVPNDQLHNSHVFYLPHHFVLKNASSTTKLRVVFDASAKGSAGYSLNDFLHVGPKLQSDIFQILLKFRTFPVALSADIEKMYRQIKVSSDHADFQRIFWRFNSDECIKVYRLLTVTYGTACAPYLAIRTLQQLAREEMVKFPIAARIAMQDFYVDDLLSGAGSVEEAKQVVNDLNDLLKSGGFNLRKWSSNVSDVLVDLPKELKSNFHTVNIEDQSLKVLGLVWNSTQDTLQINITDQEEVRSKRQLLSVIARIFDPLGFLSPTTIMLKIMMQNLWKDKVAWDENVPKEILTIWDKFKAQIQCLRTIKVPRYMMTSELQVKSTQLHGFCDASPKAYSAVVFIRVQLLSGEVFVHLVAAKSRVAPLKQMTIPRLELCAALLLARLYKSITVSIPHSFEEALFWTDSEIALCWINSDFTKDQFVNNRVQLISTLTEKKAWKHISGSNNPADCASRGILPKTLEHHSLWWQGPSWLSETNCSFIKPTEIQTHIHEPLCMPATLVHTSPGCESNIQDLIQKYSSYTKLIRVTAWCRRFINNARSQHGSRLKGTLQTDELRKALLCIVKKIQQIEFKSEIHLLESKGVLPQSSKYLSLSPFLDPDNVLRVGGRLKHSSIPNDAKHPILLPKNHHLTNLIIHYYHKLWLHSGTSVVLSAIRQKFWFTAGRDQIRKILRHCITCLKLNANTSSPLMGHLPCDRVTPSRPFHRVGIDFAGPIITKPNLPRSKITLKSYIALFICFATKAVHLELVSDLSTEAFLASFRRFISRRGIPSDIYSDNATNFKGARNYLRYLHPVIQSETIQDFVSEIQITWHFIPPLSPHFGGLWESNIKSMKRHLIKICGAATLTFEELSTLLVQIEACLNSRPLYPLSSDPNDLEPLTPGHFLIGAPLVSLPEKDPTPAMSLKSRWMLIQSLRTQFWRQWNRDYLHNLQTKAKWTVSTSNIHVGDLVLLKSDCAPSPMRWTLARIVETYPGDDGVIRVVLLRTPSGLFKRPVAKLCPLPMN